MPPLSKNILYPRINFDDIRQLKTMQPGHGQSCTVSRLPIMQDHPIASLIVKPSFTPRDNVTQPHHVQHQQHPPSRSPSCCASQYADRINALR